VNRRRFCINSMIWCVEHIPFMHFEIAKVKVSYALHPHWLVDSFVNDQLINQ